MKRFIPWWAKIIIKITLSRIPLNYGFFAKLGVFRHGQMDNAEYALHVFRRHFDRAQFPRKEGGFVALELGPGDSLVSAIIANAYNASRCYMVDAGNYAVDDVASYRHLIENLRSEGIAVDKADRCVSTEELLEQIGGVYLTDGLQSLRSIPSNSVDFIWSQAVLEHLRLSEFDEILHELLRILRSDGIASHRIDLKDHLGDALHNLRFSTKVWESDWMAQSGFYTNRIRYPDMLARFEDAGFDMDVTQVDRWDHLPVPREKISPEFFGFSDGELCVSGFDVLLCKKSTAQ